MSFAATLWRGLGDGWRQPAVRMVVALSASALLLLTAFGPSHAAPVRPRPLGVCVSSGTLPLVDKDVQVVNRIYTPAPSGRRCAKGDKFVAIGR